MFGLYLFDCISHFDSNMDLKMLAFLRKICKFLYWSSAHVCHMVNVKGRRIITTRIICWKCFEVLKKT